MIEQVAKAIAMSHFGQSLWWEQEKGGLRQSCLDDARAAIEAMRDGCLSLPLVAEYNIAPDCLKMLFDEALAGK